MAENAPYRLPQTRSAQYEWEMDLLLACGQVILYDISPERNYHIAPRLFRLFDTHTELLAKMAGVKTIALKILAQEGLTFSAGRRVRPIVTELLRALTTPPCGFLRAARLTDRCLPATALFAAHAADIVLEGNCHSFTLRRLFAFLGIPPAEWHTEAERLLDISTRPSPPFTNLFPSPGETLLDLYFELPEGYEALFGLDRIPPEPKTEAVTQEEEEEEPTKPPARPAPRRSAAAGDPPDAPICLIEPLDSLSPDLSLVLPPELQEELDFVIALCRQNLKPPLPRMLFHGPPGTGKSHAARIIARELGRPLAVATAGGFLQRYVGDSERAIERAFHEAAEAGAVLLMDEADSYITDRRTSHYSWEVTRVNAILVLLERAQIPTILCTNFIESLDEAVQRRIDHLVAFPVPAETERRKLWAMELGVKQVPLKGIDLEALAAIPLTGGLIHNAVTLASRRKLLQGDGYRLTTTELVALAHKEEKKMGTLTKGRRAMGFQIPEVEPTAPPPKGEQLTLFGE